MVRDKMNDLYCILSLMLCFETGESPLYGHHLRLLFHLPSYLTYSYDISVSTLPPIPHYPVRNVKICTRVTLPL